MKRVFLPAFFMAAHPAWAASSNNDHLFVGAIFLAVGIGLFVFGFVYFRRKRLIENTPTSKIRSMAMGLVEVKGKVLDWNPLSAPFSGERCVYYRYQVEQLESNGKSSKWETVRQGASTGCPFYVEDDTGRALVLPSGSLAVLEESFKFQTGIFSDVPAQVDRFLEGIGFSCKNLLGFNKTLRFTEYRVEPGREVYVLGSCQTNDRVVSQAYLRALNALIAEGGAVPASLPVRDLGGGVTVGTRELAFSYAGPRPPAPPLDEDRVYIGSSKGRFFLISDKGERDLTHSMFYQSFFGVFGGIALIAAGTYFLLM